ncbi:hypothetical protein ACFX2I_041184 [Malus domestica]
MAREHIRGRNWTCEEDVALCFAWVSVNEDGAVGTNQNRKVLWDKIIAKFQENCNGGGRDGGGVYDQWKTITNHALYGNEAWREPWLAWLVEGAPQKL